MESTKTNHILQLYSYNGLNSVPQKFMSAQNLGILPHLKIGSLQMQLVKISRRDPRFRVDPKFNDRYPDNEKSMRKQSEGGNVKMELDIVLTHIQGRKCRRLYSACRGTWDSFSLRAFLQREPTLLILGCQTSGLLNGEKK